jgi:simple sugar transport system ATP-binding protein
VTSGPDSIGHGATETRDSVAPALRLTGITKRFGDLVANDRVDFDVRWGEVHALLGENGAGKTTLMRMVAGLYEPDRGQIEIAGEPRRIRRPEQALEAGIGMVHQHFTLVPTLTAAENVALRPARFPTRGDLGAVAERITELAAPLGFAIDAHKLVSDATISERQRIEIVKLMYRGAEIFIFDEPSAALTPDEWVELGRLMRRLAGDGKAVVLISHKLDEVYAVADRFTVLRDGAVAGGGRIADISRAELVRMMVGREVKLRPDRPVLSAGAPVLEVRGLTVAPAERGSGRPPLHDVSFEVRANEIVGLAGIAGNGQAELVEALMGLRPAAGEVRLSGEDYAGRTPALFAQRGGALIPEDRHHVAIADEMPIWENVLMRAMTAEPFAHRGILRRSTARSRARELMSEYDVRATSENARIAQLSGGNQQKVVIARELSREPQFVVAQQPTRGLDVRASAFVYDRLNACKSAGAGVLLISMDLDEVLALSDRVLVIAGGRITGELAAGEATQEAVGALMTGAAA